MLDFTSALYLGMHHESGCLEPWSQFTTGRPAALSEPAEARAIARALADLQGTEAAVLAASTFHLAWDLFLFLAKKDRVEVCMDAGTYPIARWGIERASCHGVPVQRFAHHSTEQLEQSVQLARRHGRRPLIVTDGFCPGCGCPAPLRQYLACAERYEGWLVLDDTQALGVLGAEPDQAMAYGYQGGGSLRHCNLQSPRALVFSSLAKGFGVPVAVLAGHHATVGGFERASSTRLHCSPPSIATLRAARHALALNRRCGNALRRRVLNRVHLFQAALRRIGLAATPGLFPVQTLQTDSTIDPIRLHEKLLEWNIRTVLQRRHGGSGARVTFLLTADHSPEDIEHVTAAIQTAVHGTECQPDAEPWADGFPPCRRTGRKSARNPFQPAKHTDKALGTAT